VTALHIACARGHTKVVQRLRPSIESFSRKDAFGRTPMDYALMSAASMRAYYKIWSNSRHIQTTQPNTTESIMEGTHDSVTHNDQTSSGAYSFAANPFFAAIMRGESGGMSLPAAERILRACMRLRIAPAEGYAEIRLRHTSAMKHKKKLSAEKKAGSEKNTPLSNKTPRARFLVPAEKSAGKKSEETTVPTEKSVLYTCMLENEASVWRIEKEGVFAGSVLAGIFGVGSKHDVRRALWVAASMGEHASWMSLVRVYTQTGDDDSYNSVYKPVDDESWNAYGQGNSSDESNNKTMHDDTTPLSTHDLEIICEGVWAAAFMAPESACILILDEMLAYGAHSFLLQTPPEYVKHRVGDLIESYTVTPQAHKNSPAKCMDTQNVSSPEHVYRSSVGERHAYDTPNTIAQNSVRGVSSPEHVYRSPVAERYAYDTPNTIAQNSVRGVSSPEHVYRSPVAERHAYNAQSATSEYAHSHATYEQSRTPNTHAHTRASYTSASTSPYAHSHTPVSGMTERNNIDTHTPKDPGSTFRHACRSIWASFDESTDDRAHAHNTNQATSTQVITGAACLLYVSLQRGFASFASKIIQAYHTHLATLSPRTTALIFAMATASGCTDSVVEWTRIGGMNASVERELDRECLHWRAVLRALVAQTRSNFADSYARVRADVPDIDIEHRNAESESVQVKSTTCVDPQPHRDGNNLDVKHTDAANVQRKRIHVDAEARRDDASSRLSDTYTTMSHRTVPVTRVCRDDDRVVLCLHDMVLKRCMERLLDAFVVVRHVCTRCVYVCVYI
jgi:hypothetical protein